MGLPLTSAWLAPSRLCISSRRAGRRRIQAGALYAANLAALPSADNVQTLELFGFGRLGTRKEQLDRVLRNEAGALGCFKIFSYLCREYGSITPHVARKGLEFYAELVDDAARNPGKHPNIELLQRVARTESTLVCKLDGVYQC